MVFLVKFERLDTRVYEVMKEEIRKLVSMGKAIGVLRFVFHDAGTFQLDDNSGTLFEYPYIIGCIVFGLYGHAY